MALSNTAVPKYYGQFREAVMQREIPVCKEISMKGGKFKMWEYNYTPDPNELYH